MSSPLFGLEDLFAWLDEPRRRGGVLVLRAEGDANLRTVFDRLIRHVPEPVVVDCRQLTAEEVAVRVLLGLGVAPDDARQRRRSLRDAQRLLRRDAVILLTGVPWAGPTVTSTEPQRILRQVADSLGADDRHCIRVVVEGDSCRDRVPRLRRRPEVLIGGENADRTAAITRRAFRAVEGQPALRVLAAAETPHVSYAVWESLCDALGTGAPDLGGLSDDSAGLVSVMADNDGGQVVMASDDLRTLIRRDLPLTPYEQRGIVRHLSASATRSSATARYARRTLPLHAVHGGLMETLLADGEQLAGVDRYALLQGIAAAWPDGTPQDSLAAAVHYLETESVDPASHGEWISWLHWAALARGSIGIADGLLRTATVLPWQTTWSHWRPCAVLGPIDGELGRVDQVRVQCRTGGSVAVMRRVVRFDDMGGPVDDSYIERAFDLDTGAEIGTAATVRVPHDEDPAPAPEFHQERALPLPPLPHPGGEVRSAGSGRWVIGGRGGMYSVRTAKTPPSATDVSLDGPYLGAVTPPVHWKCPEEAHTADAPSRAWLERLFGRGSCRPVDEALLPQGLRDQSARSFLKTVGLPLLTHQVPFFATTDLGGEGLQEFRWPEDKPAPETEGPFYRIGSWTGGAVILDGFTGSVLQDTESGYSTVLLAESLPRFFTVIALYRQYLLSWFPCRAERLDALWALRTWAEDIAPVTADGDHWDQVFDGDLDDFGAR